MSATSDPPTWRILPSAGGHFRWASAQGDVSRPKELGEILAGRTASRLPSVADLVHQASPMLLERGGGGGDGGGLPMFRTGSGRPVSVSESAVRKAVDVLEGGDVSERVGLMQEGSGGVRDRGGVPMFRTGSGRPVSVNETSIQKAAAVLEGGDGPGIGGSVGGRIGDEVFSMCQTGLEKSVIVRQSSIRKAAAVLRAEDLKRGVPQAGCDNSGAPVFQTGSGRSIQLKQSSIRKAISVLQDEDNKERDKMHINKTDASCTFSSSVFQTGSGKTLNISSAGLTTATTLLGLEGNYNLSSHGDVSGNLNPGFAGTFSLDLMHKGSFKSNLWTSSRDLHVSGDQSINARHHDHGDSRVHASGSANPPIQFQTAGGRSVSLSSRALQRARSLLGESALEDLQDDIKANKQLSAVPEDKEAFVDSSWNKENASFDCMEQDTGIFKHIMVPPRVQLCADVRPFCSPLQLPDKRITMLNHMNANGSSPQGSHMPSGNLSHIQEPASEYHSLKPSSDCVMRTLPACRPLSQPLVNISNYIGADNATTKCLIGEKKSVGRRPSISPFKRPRSSRFNTPLKSNTSFSSSGASMLSTSENCYCRTRISSRYPFQFKKQTIKDFFGGPPSQHDLIGDLADEVRRLNADNAATYKFHHASGFLEIGPETLQKMLLQSGALSSDATKEWVVNHYKWIVWKLSCYERDYPVQANGKYLTITNVLEELKYRYDREFNYGHRPAIKKVLDGDASPASMVILCVSAIRSFRENNNITKVDDENEHHEYGEKRTCSKLLDANHHARIELTDGWYSLDAILDQSLSNQLIAGKIFVGQKLRIWGAGLCGWVGPVSPLEASNMVSLVLHANGTYRAQWADPLGFCRGLGKPLAFSCIKVAGGKVPRTLVGLARIYPALYKERFPDGGSIVRSERAEKKFLQLYNQRRSTVIEDIIAEQQGALVNHDDGEEGANIYKILETAAEPELLMADMSSEQLSSFATYQAKREEIRQSDILKKIEEALKDAGLTSREVTPFMRVRVVGLRSKDSSKKGRPREGLITIWNPTEKQKVDLVEGQIYSVTGLMPLSFGCDIIYLQGRGSSTLWKSIPSKEIEKFEPFFTPRRSIPLSALGEVALASEFDIAAVVVHVGETYVCGRQIKQWLFLADGSKCSSENEEPYDCLLAVSFCSSINDNDSSTLVSHSISGTTVAFSNLVKRTRDQMNRLWVAEATDNSAYSLCCNLPSGHLKQAADSVQKWEKESCLAIQKLRERVLYIVNDFRR